MGQITAVMFQVQASRFVIRTLNNNHTSLRADETVALNVKGCALRNLPTQSDRLSPNSRERDSRLVEYRAAPLKILQQTSPGSTFPNGCLLHAGRMLRVTNASGPCVHIPRCRCATDITKPTAFPPCSWAPRRILTI